MMRPVRLAAAHVKPPLPEVVLGDLKRFEINRMPAVIGEFIAIDHLS
jgi:hypothetical protein